MTKHCGDGTLSNGERTSRIRIFFGHVSISNKCKRKHMTKHCGDGTLSNGERTSRIHIFLAMFLYQTNVRENA